MTPWRSGLVGLLHARAHTLRTDTRTRQRSECIAHTSEQDFERVSLDTMGDQGSSACCTRELARFVRTRARNPVWLGGGWLGGRVAGWWASAGWLTGGRGVKKHPFEIRIGVSRGKCEAEAAVRLMCA